MKILLVNPRQSTSLFTFSDVEDITGCRAFMPNLALPTLAALTPSHVNLTLLDENVEPLDWCLEERWDAVSITGYITQAPRMIELAAEFRRRGNLIVMGGPFATLSSSTVRPHADVLFVGEAELTWPAFLVNNLLPVTIGNIIGGTVLVAAVYWIIFLRPEES